MPSAVSAPMSPVAGVATRLGQQSWALFHVARDPYNALIVIYIFGPYFSSQVIGDPVRGQEIWGYINAFAAAVTACLAPFLGAIADKVGKRKPWVAGSIAVMVPAILLLWFATPGASAGGIALVAIALAISGTAFSFTIVFHNAMLPSVSAYERMGSLSGLGLAWGNAGSLFLLVLLLYGFALPASGLFDVPWLPDKVWLGLDTAAAEHNRIVAPILAAWLVLMSLPFFLFTPDCDGTGIGATQAVRSGMADVWQTVKELRHYQNIARYLLAHMVYNDGIVAASTFGMIYASGMFGWGIAEVLLVGIYLTAVAIIGSLIGGRLDDRLGSRKNIMLMVAGLCVSFIISISMTPTTIFFIAFEGLVEPVWNSPYFETLPEIVYIAAVSLFVLCTPAAMSSSRTMLARIAPKTEMTKFFGLYSLSGEVTVFVGPIMVAFFTGYFDSQRIGMLPILFLLAGGLALMFFVKEERTAPLPVVSPGSTPAA